MADDEDWRLLLERYLPPYHPDADPDAGPDDDLPWRAVLRAAASRARPSTNGAMPARSGPRPRRTPEPSPAVRSASPAQGGRHTAAAGEIRPDPVVRVGDRVALTSLAGARGVVVAVERLQVLVQTPTARVRVAHGDLVVLAGGPDPASARPSVAVAPARQARPHLKGKRRGRHGPSLDLHGLTLSEALDLLDRFLYESWEQGQLSVVVIHGKGTGTLRDAVRALLGAHPAVRQSHGALPNSGGDGVTIVELSSRPPFFHDPGTR